VKDPYGSADKPVAEFTASDLMSDVEFTMHVALRYDWRYRLGLWLVKLGIRLMGAKVKVEGEESLP
jgi:hypothetical protein